MSAASDNAMAAAGARAGLTGLGDFLYRLQVQKPFMQAQTKQIGAQTGLSEAEAEEARARVAQLKAATEQSGKLFP